MFTSKAPILHPKRLITWLIVDHEWFCRYPRPRMAIYDNGSEFQSEFLELLHSYGIIPKPTTIKNPRANCVVERIQDDTLL